MSMSRRSVLYKAVNGQWFLELGDKEYAYDYEDSTTYGPFTTEEEGNKELDRHSNPGHLDTDNSGTRPVPTVSGNGLKVQPPSRPRRCYW